MSAALATTTSVPAQPATPSGPPPREAAKAEAPLSPSQGSSQQASQPSAAPKAPPTAPAVGFTLAFDADTQRLILEARDPSSGIVIYQIPPKSAITQLSSSASAVPQRGATVDSAV